MHNSTTHMLMKNSNFAVMESKYRTQHRTSYVQLLELEIMSVQLLAFYYIFFKKRILI